MQRKELKKAIRKFSHETNFYKLGLVRKLLQKQEKDHKILIAAIPKIQCPHCKSRKIDIDSDDCDYSDEKWLHCCKCGRDFDDVFGYIDSIEELDCEPWGDEIAIELYFENPNIKSQKWQEFCKNTILKELGLKNESKTEDYFDCIL